MMIKLFFLESMSLLNFDIFGFVSFFSLFSPVNRVYYLFNKLTKVIF